LLIYDLKCCASCQEIETVTTLFLSYNSTAAGLRAIVEPGTGRLPWYWACKFFWVFLAFRLSVPHILSFLMSFVSVYSMIMSLFQFSLPVSKWLFLSLFLFCLPQCFFSLLCLSLDQIYLSQSDKILITKVKSNSSTTSHCAHCLPLARRGGFCHHPTLLNSGSCCPLHRDQEPGKSKTTWICRRAASPKDPARLWLYWPFRSLHAHLGES